MSQSNRVDLVYAGAVQHAGEIHHAYYVVSEGGLSERASLYARPLGDFPPGAVCSYATTLNGSAVDDSNVTFKGMFDDDALVQQWMVRHAAVQASELAWSSKDLPPLFACMNPIRDAYHQVDAESRALLLAQVVRYIVTGE